MPIEVSVVVPTYKRPDLLKRCLQALLSQDFDPSAYEVIVVDDAAEEETRRVVESLAQQAETYAVLPGPDFPQPAHSRASLDMPHTQVKIHSSWVGLSGLPRLMYIPVLKRCGPAAARNCGWRATAGEIIAFTDDDCIPAQDWLRTGVRAFDGGADGVSGRVIVPLPPDPTDYERDAAGLSRSLFVTANCFYRREVLSLAGGFDEDFSLPWREDSDLYFRLLRLGCKLIEAPDAVVIHPVRPVRWGISLKQQRKSMFNALLYKKHPKLYRRMLQANPPWGYYFTLAALFVTLFALISQNPTLFWIGFGVWTTLTLRFCVQRLVQASRSLSHLIEMLITSALIPPLSVYWRLRGAIKFRVFFL
jgi:cellulose synthase/poly-beta-1,6-N-acetylglucosamine synthase-like glycosyltransferase